VLVITGRPETAARLTMSASTSVVGILWKPVFGATLHRVVGAALAAHSARRTAGPGDLQCRRRELIRRLLVEAPDALAFQIYRRLHTDRRRCRPRAPGDPPTWAEIAAWARGEGLLDCAQARLMGCGGQPEAENVDETLA
jgi:hypothetical protein